MTDHLPSKGMCTDCLSTETRGGKIVHKDGCSYVEIVPLPSKDLLPCPFCGSQPRWCKDEEHECHLIVCTGCAISIDFQENPDTETVQELRDIMAAKWNRRARSVEEINAAVDERLDRVERELARSKDLLPCPFCGGVARWCKDDEHECHLVVCSDCKISIDFQENPDTETVQELRDIMAEKWNRRASQPPGDGWDANGSPVST